MLDHSLAGRRLANERTARTTAQGRIYCLLLSLNHRRYHLLENRKDKTSQLNPKLPLFSGLRGEW